MPNDSPPKKAIYAASRQITPEKMLALKDVITPSQIASAKYLARLDAAPNISSLPPFNTMRFRG